MPARLIAPAARLSAVAIAATCLLATAGRADAADGLVTLVRGSSYQLLEDGDSSTLRIPVELREGVAASDLTIETVDVSLGQLEQPALAEAFVPSIQARSHNLGPALILTVKAPDGLRPGTYDVILGIHNRDPEQQRLDIQVTHPAAQLESPPTIVIERTIPFLFWRTASAKPTSVVLRETSGQSRASSVAITQLYATKIGSETVSGGLRFDQPNPIKPRGTAEQHFSLDGNFPVGTSSGSVVVNAPQLETPLTVNFEVHTRRSLAWLFIVAAFGLAIGALTRTWLKDRIALQDAKLRAAQLLTTIDRELSQRRDSDFQTNVRATRATLDTATDSNDPKAIADATATANTDLQTELAALVARRNTEQTAFEALDSDLETNWLLPHSLVGAVASARTAVASAAARLPQDDVSRARTERKELERTLVKELQEGAEQWSSDLQPLLDFLADPSRQMDTELVPDPEEAAKAALTLLAAPDLINPAATPHAVLSALNDAAGSVNTVLRQVLPKLQLAGRDVTLILQLATPTDTGAVAALSEAVDELAKLIPTAELQPDAERTQALRAAIQTLLARMRDAILAQRKDAPDEERKPIDDLVAAGRYREAATSMAQLLNKRRDRPLGGDGQTAPTVVVPPIPAGFAGDSVAPRASSRGIVLPAGLVAPQPLAVRLYRARWSLLLAQLAQSLLLGIVVVVVAYTLYEPTYVGTGAQLAAIFLWAFAIDISVDAVLTAARGSRS